MTYSPRQGHYARKAHLVARLNELEAAGELSGPNVPWTPAADAVLLTTPESVHALAVLTRRTPAAVRARRLELYYLPTVHALRDLPDILPVLDSRGTVHTSDDVAGIALPAAVILGRANSTVDELKAAAQAVLDHHAGGAA